MHGRASHPLPATAWNHALANPPSPAPAGNLTDPARISPREPIIITTVRWFRRVIGPLAVLLLVAAIGSDFLIAGFWVSHPMLTAIIPALVVVLLSVAVIDVVLDRRAEQRWRLLAQYALVELAEGAHTVWVRLADELNVSGAEHLSTEDLQGVLNSPAQAPAIRRELASTLADPGRREGLRRLLEDLSQAGRLHLTGWAAVMTGSRSYAEIFDQHVELWSFIHALHHYLAYGSHVGERFLPADLDVREDVLYPDLLLNVFNNAARLESETWALAFRLTPAEWWLRRVSARAAPAHAADIPRPSRG